MNTNELSIIDHNGSDLWFDTPADWVGSSLFSDAVWLDIISAVAQGKVVQKVFLYNSQPLVVVSQYNHQSILGKYSVFPPFTPYWGLAWYKDTPLEIISTAIQFALKGLCGIRISLPPGTSIPCTGKAWRQQNRKTILITPKTESEQWEELSTSCKQKIRSADRAAVVLDDAGVDELMLLMENTFVNKQIKKKLDSASLKTFISSIITKEIGIIRCIRSEEGNAEHVRLTVNDIKRKLSYDLIAARNIDSNYHGGNYLLWRIIRFQTENGYTLDLTGINTSGVSEFKRSFGGMEIPYSIIEMHQTKLSQIHYRLLRRMNL